MKIYCIRCTVEYHDGMTCEQYQQMQQERKEKALLQDNLGMLPIKPCPKCRAPIEKTEGCNAMRCTLCSIAFCWLCGFSDKDDGMYRLP